MERLAKKGRKKGFGNLDFEKWVLEKSDRYVCTLGQQNEIRCLKMHDDKIDVCEIRMKKKETKKVTMPFYILSFRNRIGALLIECDSWKGYSTWVRDI